MTGRTPTSGPLPDWLPDLVTASADWIAYIEQLWLHYQDDFIRNQTYWRGKAVFLDKDPQVSGKDHSFWHIISGIDKNTKELKDPEPERCARLPWVRPMLEAPEYEVRTWIQATRNGAIALALPDFSYLVIIKELKNIVFLKSAFYIRPARRDQLRNEYKRSIKR